MHDSERASNTLGPRHRRIAEVEMHDENGGLATGTAAVTLDARSSNAAALRRRRSSHGVPTGSACRSSNWSTVRD